MTLRREVSDYEEDISNEKVGFLDDVGTFPAPFFLPAVSSQIEGLVSTYNSFRVFRHLSSFDLDNAHRNVVVAAAFVG